jgi:Lar family restriction alleviation protein
MAQEWSEDDYRPKNPIPLAPCPFCGGTAKMVGGAEFGSEGVGQPTFSVSCSECGVEMPSRYFEEEAATAWNRRQGVAGPLYKMEEMAFEAATMALVASARLLALWEILDPESATSLSCCARMVIARKLVGEARKQLLGIAKLLTALAGESRGAAEPQETDESAGEDFLREISLLQESRSRLAKACEWLLPHFEEAVRDGGDHFEQRFCEEVVKRLREALERPGGASPAAESQAEPATTGDDQAAG